MRFCLALAVAALFPLPALRAQHPPIDSALVLIEHAVAASRPDDLSAPLSLLGDALSVAPGDGLVLHWQGYAWYRRGSLLMAAGRKGEAKRALDEAESLLTRSASTLPLPETYALLAAVFGQKVGLTSNPISIARTGSRSNQMMDRALALGPNNPRVILLRGISYLHRPGMFGGSTEKALRDLLRATVLFTNDHPSAPLPAWGHDEAWAWLGAAYVRERQYVEARAAYDHALSITPEYALVRDTLLPELERLARERP